jgi:hypothetical protein
MNSTISSMTINFDVNSRVRVAAVGKCEAGSKRLAHLRTGEWQ